MARILSTDGNVVSADFRPRGEAFTITFKSEVLYLDGSVALLRIVGRIDADGKVIFAVHLLADLATGAAAQL
jgi:hypothetical protein